jgi:hypothetical protein
MIFNTVSIMYVPSDEQLADALTKALSPQKHRFNWRNLLIENMTA